MRPKYLILVILVLALGWTGNWFIGAARLAGAGEDWRAARRDAGWQVEWQAFEVQGFPNRFDTVITEPLIADTRNAWAWSAPWLQLLRLSYRADHLIVVWPETQTLQTPWERIAIGGADLQGSVVFRPGTERVLDRSSFVFDQLQLVSDAGWRVSLAEARLATRVAAGTEDARVHDISFQATELVPPARLLADLAEADLVPGAMERISADMTLTFDRPWDRRALEEERPLPVAAKLRDISASWGQLDLRLAGDLSVAEDGRLDGMVQVKATNWREIVELGKSSGGLPEGFADLLIDALELVSGLAGSPKTLDIPVSFANGRAWIGPVPIGAAPRLSLR